MLEIQTLDVTRIAPPFKHPAIFRQFDALQEGEAFIIHNDHDPKPLYYQLLAERGDIFNWEYLLQGPDAWEIKVTKKELSPREKTIGAIAAEDLRKAEVFKKMGVEFCCGGNKTLDAACEDAGISLKEVEKALADISDQPVPSDRDYNSWELDFLADYIVNIHHNYVRESVRPLTDLADKINRVHGGAHPELAEIQEHVKILLREMVSHQIKEEKILFPFIRQMVKCKKEDKPFIDPSFGPVENPIEMMLDDHNIAAKHIHAIEELSKGYEVPRDGCESYRLYFYKLKGFDDDLHQHIHLENNILFPKAIAMEKDLSNL